MNYNILRYRTARNALIDARDVVERLGERPICMMSCGEVEMYAAAEERTVLIPQMIDRLRFLAKHDRSKYTSHIGNKQRCKYDNRPVCGYYYSPREWGDELHV